MKKTRKFLPIVLAVLLVAALAPSAFAEDAMPEMLSDQATITEIDLENEFVLIKTDGGTHEQIRLNINDDTLFLDSAEVNFLDFSDLEKDMKIRAYYSPVMTRSEPPQSNCFAIVTNFLADQEAKLVRVGEITESTDEHVKFLTADGGMIITVPADIMIAQIVESEASSIVDLEDISEGALLFAWIGIVATSHPAQATAAMVVIAEFGADDGEDGENGGNGDAAPAEVVEPISVAPTPMVVYVDGEEVAFDAYLIHGNNYFKLRDLAFALSGTDKQFDVGYDPATQAITLTSGEEYTEVGGEMQSKGSGAKNAVPTKSKIYLDDEEVHFTAYLIDGNNYFKLRDIGKAFDFGVGYDGSVLIDSDKGYVEDDGANNADDADDADDADGSNGADDGEDDGEDEEGEEGEE